MGRNLPAAGSLPVAASIADGVDRGLADVSLGGLPRACWMWTCNRQRAVLHGQAGRVAGTNGTRCRGSLLLEQGDCWGQSSVIRASWSLVARSSANCSSRMHDANGGPLPGPWLRALLGVIVQCVHALAIGQPWPYALLRTTPCHTTCHRRVEVVKGGRAGSLC